MHVPESNQIKPHKRLCLKAESVWHKEEWTWGCDAEVRQGSLLSVSSPATASNKILKVPKETP